MRPPRWGCFVSVTVGQRNFQPLPQAGLPAPGALPTVLVWCRHCARPFFLHLLRCAFVRAYIRLPVSFGQRHDPRGLIRWPSGTSTDRMVARELENVLGTSLPAGEENPPWARDYLRATGPRASAARRCAHGGPRHGCLPGGPRHTVAPRCGRRRAHPAARARRLAAAAAAGKRRHATARGARGPRAARLATGGRPVSSLADAAMGAATQLRAALRDVL